ncbi:hypothetical protein BS78_01G047900 [Paspalum vaginatum]|nr:hypothetical protein BS78_01G047900 [Paspalum vaginatum]
MDATRSFLALEWFVPVHGLKVTPAGKEGAAITSPGEEDWASVTCASKKAYGCGKHGQRLLDGLTLYVSRAKHPDIVASVSIGLSDDAVRTMEAELGVPRSLMNSDGSVQISHQQFLVMVLGFFPHARPKRWYYLVYDSTDASQAVPERSADGAGLKLALTAREPILQLADLRRVDLDRLCVFSFSPAAQTDPESIRWQTKAHAFMQDRRQPFSADVVFSFQGKVFWADLSQCVKYSDLSTTGRSGSGLAVDTRHHQAAR